MAHKRSKGAKGSKPVAGGKPATPPVSGASWAPLHQADTSPEPLPFPVVGVGASAGGLEAFTQLLKALPVDTGMGFVLVQHLAPTHASALTEILSRATTMPVREVQDGVTVEPNQVYVIPPGQDMVISEGALRLMAREGQKVPRPIDQFFRALAEDQRYQAIGVVLSGTASDGTVGLEAIKSEGGITFAQDATAQHQGMPQSAIASGSVDFVLPPDEIAREIARIGRYPHTTAGSQLPGQEDAPNLTPVVQALHQATGIDFTHYKFNTLYRRITRRMILQKTDGLDEYVRFLRQTPREADALQQDILIGVTNFFRNPEAFEALKQTTFPHLFTDRSRTEPVRMWALGCSTGQEAYSLAIAFTEFAEAEGIRAPLQIFGTDLNAASVVKARAGVFSKEIAQEVSPERLRRFFTEVDGGYRISKPIRDTCIFSQHNALADPPFSRMDLISCRNLLIYLEPPLQQKILAAVHYALKPSGCLWLGSSETIGGHRNLFEAVDAKYKFYCKKPGASPGHGHLPRQDGEPRPQFTPVTARPGGGGTDLPREVDRLLLSRFAPPGVLVSADLEILQYRGDTGPYLAPAPGKASLSLLKMLREGLLIPIRATVMRAAQQNSPVREEGIRIESDGGHREIAVEVIPVPGDGRTGSGFLILFQDTTAPRRRKPSRGKQPAPAAAAAVSETARLAQELSATREYLQSMIELQDTANEELQSSNEEVQSANEELQSANEELETSKEEIESSNEELVTVNDELNNRNTEMNRLNTDLENLLGSVQLAVIMIGPDLRLRRLTTEAGKVLNLGPTDIGRPLGQIRLPFDLPDLELLLAEVLETGNALEREVRDQEGRWFSLRLRPCKTSEGRIDGAVAMLVDVTAMKHAHEFTDSIVETVREPLLVLDAQMRVQAASRSFYQTFQTTPETTERESLYALGNRQWDIPELRRLLEEILPRSKQVQNFVVELESEDSAKKTMLLNARRLVQMGDTSPLILLAIEDITERKLAEETLLGRLSRFEALFDAAPIGVYLVDASLRIRQVNPIARTVFGDIGELIGSDFVEVLHLVWPPGIADELVAFFRHTLATGEPYSAPEFVVDRVDRDQRDFYEWYLHRIPLPEGQYGVVCYFQDISARVLGRQALAESERRMRFMAESMPQKVFTAKPNGDVDYFNPQWSEFTGLPFETIKDWGWTQFIHPDDVAENVRVWRHSIDTGERFHFEHRFRRADGEYRWHLTRALPLRDESGRVVMWIGSNTDIHEYRQTANLLRQNAADLSEADRHKNEFLAMLAHELRNPLAPIRNALQIMRLTGGYGEPAQSASEMMERQVGQIVRLVDDLLDVSRVSRGKIELRKGRVELASAVNHAVEAIRSSCDSRNLELTVTLPPEPIYLHADPTRLAQVVGNLLNNACKYTNAGGRIELTVWREGEQAVLLVRDSGIGISVANLPHVFDMFMQVDNRLERSVGGLGLGLTLVKNLVELHHGTVEAKSAGPGQGSEFLVRLPIMSATLEPPPTPAVGGPGSMTARRILVVDDNRDSAESLAMLLKLTGNETRLAYDGLEALEAAAAFQPDLVLLDIGLPKLNGYEVARKIRQAPWGKEMLLVALTGWGQEEDRQRSKAAGFNGHLVKPVDLTTLVELLAGLGEKAWAS